MAKKKIVTEEIKQQSNDNEIIPLLKDIKALLEEILKRTRPTGEDIFGGKQ